MINKPFELPMEIQMGCRNITIEMCDELVFDDDSTGEASHRRNRIRIQNSSKAYPIQRVIQVETYFHELLHFALDIAEYKELNNNEDFVNRVAGFLAQAALSARYGGKKS